MTLNPDLIRARCAEIDASLIRRDQLRQLPREAFLSNQDTLDVACYRLLIAIEASLALFMCRRNNCIGCPKNTLAASARSNRPG